MSLSRSTLIELCESVQHKPSTVLGIKFFDTRLVIPVEASYKPDKYDQRLLVISKFRLFILNGKTSGSLKIEKSFHLLVIKSINAVTEDEVHLNTDDGVHRRKISIKTSSSQYNSIYIAQQILSALKHYFQDVESQIENMIELQPKSLYCDFLNIATPPSRPCHSFRRIYAALCDYFEQPYREEVSWDIEKIYSSNKIRDLRIDDFSHLLPRDLLPIVAVLQYSSYFHGLICDGVRLSSDVIDVILNCVRRSQYMRKLQLRQCGLPKDFMSLLSTAIMANPFSCLEIIDFSKNQIDDKKGFTSFATYLQRSQNLNYVNLSDCQLSEKSINLLCSGLYNGMTSCKVDGMKLTELNISSNNIRDDVSMVVNLISVCPSLRCLDLSDTGIVIDKLWNGLKYGGLQIEKLILAGCTVGKKNDCLQAAKEYFSMAVNLNHISLNRTQIPSDYLKSILLGLASNQQLQPFRLELDSTFEKGSANVVDACIGNIRCEMLSLRDNNIDGDLQGILQSLMLIPSLRRLDIGGNNFNQLKRSNKNSSLVNKVLLELVKLYSEDGVLEELNLSECRLGNCLSVLLNTLGSTNTLKSLDISGNEIGNFGARILSKALQVNVSLKFLAIDNNHIASEGFIDLATSLKLNHTITHIPYPVNDVCECMQRAEKTRTVAALSQIQNSLYRNRSSSFVDEANCKKLLTGLPQQIGKLRNSHMQELVSTNCEGFPEKLTVLVDDFVSQFQREASILIMESVGKVVKSDLSSKRAEQAASIRLNEIWKDVAKHIYSDWKWQETCESLELELSSSPNEIETVSDSMSLGRSSSVGTGSPSISSPFTQKRTGHRPKSIIADISNEVIGGGIEQGVNLDFPPKPSNLSHLQKARPRKKAGSSVLKPSLNNREESISEEHENVSDDQNSRQIATGRVAMIPDTSIISKVQLRPTTDVDEIKAFPKENNIMENPIPDSPPPLPARNRIVPMKLSSPPLLPPKPEPRPRLTAEVPQTSPLANSPEDGNSSSSRRSVADMARFFNK